MRAVFGTQETPSFKNGLPIGTNKRIFKKRVKQNGNTTHAVHSKAETSLAGEEGFHIIDSDGRTEQMICIGARSNSSQLLARESAVKRKK